MKTKLYAGRCGGCGVPITSNECHECGWRSRAARDKAKTPADTSMERQIADEKLAAQIQREEHQATEEAYRRHPELRQRQNENRDEWVARMRDIARGGWRQLHAKDQG